MPPSLSPSDHTRLSAYTDLNFNPRKLATHCNLPLLDVITWLNAPHIRSHLREIRKTFARSLKDRAGLSRHTVIDALEDVIEQTEDLVEKRRAATTLLRALNPPRRPARHIHSTGTPSPSLAHSRPADLTSPRPVSSASSSSQISNFKSEIASSPASDLASAIHAPSHPSPSSSSSSPLPHSAPAAASTYASPSAAADQFDHEVNDEADRQDAASQERDSGSSSLTPSLRPSVTLPLPSADSRPSPSVSPAPEGRTTIATGEAERNPWNADLPSPRPEPAEETIETISREALKKCITRFGATDPWISLLNPDGTINLERVNEIADQIDNEDEDDLDSESDDQADDETSEDTSDEDQPDDFQDSRPPVRTSSRRSFAHNTS